MNKYTQITEKEREKIFLCLIKGLKQKEISEILGLSPSTISREIKRNSILIDFRFNNNPKEKEKKKTITIFQIEHKLSMKREKRKH